MLHRDSENYNLQTSWPITMQDAAKAVVELGLGCTHHSYYRLWTVYCSVYVGTSNVYHETLLKRCGDGWCGERTPGTGQRSSSKGSWNAGTCKDLPGSRSKPPSSKAGTIPLRSGLKANPECLICLAGACDILKPVVDILYYEMFCVRQGAKEVQAGGLLCYLSFILAPGCWGAIREGRDSRTCKRRIGNRPWWLSKSVASQHCLNVCLPYRCWDPPSGICIHCWSYEVTCLTHRSIFWDESNVLQPGKGLFRKPSHFMSHFMSVSQPCEYQYSPQGCDMSKLLSSMLYEDEIPSGLLRSAICMANVCAWDRMVSETQGIFLPEWT